jgi:hypothetical protein
VSAWSGVAVPTAPINPLAAARQPNTPSAVAAAGAAAAAAAAGGGGGLGMGDAAAYPAVLRTGLDAVPAQGMGQQMYPNIRPGGVASHFHNAAAAADQVGTGGGGGAHMQPAPRGWLNIQPPCLVTCTCTYTHTLAFLLHAQMPIFPITHPLPHCPPPCMSLQAGGSTPLRHASDVAMSSLSGTEPGGPLGQASADDAQVREQGTGLRPSS